MEEGERKYRGNGSKPPQPTVSPQPNPSTQQQIGRVTREAKLKQLLNDPKVSKADKGWMRNEIRQQKTGNHSHIKNPPGKDLRHEPKKAAAQGHDYRGTQLQDRATHRNQHRYLKETKSGTEIRQPKTPPKPPLPLPR